MNAGEFIAFAGALAVTVKPTVAGSRSAVSRACYGAFLYAREWVEDDLGIKCSAGGSEHAYLQRLLIHCGVPEAVEIGKLLQNLQESRKEADYDLKCPNQDSPAAARNGVERAQEILSRLGACQRSPLRDQIQAGMLDYKRKING